MPSGSSQTPEELILDVLREVLARQSRTLKPSEGSPREPQSDQPAKREDSLAGRAAAAPQAAVAPPVKAAAGQTHAPEDSEGELAPLTPEEERELAEFRELAAQPLSPSSLSRTVRLLVGALLLALVVINLPLFDGLALARALPDRRALIIRDGLVLKGSGPEIYVLEDNHKRWISSLAAFERLGYTWEEVHLVEDAFLQQFPEGRPLHVLLKCEASPHIYRIEREQKRWIKDIPTFLAEGHVWEDVRFVSCGELRGIPDGPPIPLDAGEPPQP